MTLLTEIREYFFLRELGNNQIKELPTGVFNNNTELIKLCVIVFFLTLVIIAFDVPRVLSHCQLNVIKKVLKLSRCSQPLKG